jgi:hypothetical protein
VKLGGETEAIICPPAARGGAAFRRRRAGLCNVIVGKCRRCKLWWLWPILVGADGALQSSARLRQNNARFNLLSLLFHASHMTCQTISCSKFLLMFQKFRPGCQPLAAEH